MFTLLRGGHVFAPDDRGTLDVLLCRDAIAAMAPSIDAAALPAPVTVVDVRGQHVVPGFIDQHIHLIGGGGAEGFETRLPELWLSDFARAGITTAVGAPGVDTASKPAETLLAKAYGLDRDGMTAFVYAGGFVRPWASLTESVVGDLYAIPKVLGVKVALGEHRASRYRDEELIELAAQLHWTRGLTGKACVFHAHLGLRRAPAEQLASVIERSELPPDRFVATHVNYGPATLDAAPGLAKLGAWIDITSVLGPWSSAKESIKASLAVRRFLDAGVPLGRISISSDANASVPQVDATGRRQPYWTKIGTLPDAVRDLVIEERLPLTDALRLVTEHPARALGIEATKGALAPGHDADVTILDADLRVRRVYARGRCILADGAPTAKSLFEDRVLRPEDAGR